MSRPLRIQYEGAWYHVMNRGAAHKNIFLCNKHRELFLNLLDQIHKKFKIEIHAYCLMTNHYHLLVRTPLSNLNKCMHHLNGAYTQQFNRNQKTDGALFRGRYKAILVEEEDYLIKLSRYIHLNPVIAKICVRVEDYTWSSYQFYIKKQIPPSWLYCKNILDRLGEERQSCGYEEFVLDGIDEEISLFYEKKKKFPILGSNKFLKIIKARYLKNKSIDPDIPDSNAINKKLIPTVNQVIYKVTTYYKADLQNLKLKHRGKTNLIRSIAIYIAIENCQKPLHYIGNEMGLTRNGVSNSYRRFRAELQNNIGLMTEITEIIKSLEEDMVMESFDPIMIPL